MMSYKHWVLESFTEEQFKELPEPLRKTLRRYFMSNKISITFGAVNHEKKVITDYIPIDELLKKWRCSKYLPTI